MDGEKRRSPALDNAIGLCYRLRLLPLAGCMLAQYCAHACYTRHCHQGVRS
jgi:hypothetical protein